MSTSPRRHHVGRARPRPARVITVLAVSALLACSGPAHFERGRYWDAHVSFSVGDPGDGWTQVRLPTTNVAWFQHALGASILVNSHCEGVADATLEALTGDLTMGMSEPQLVSQERKSWSRRAALESVVTARLDGVERKLSLFVLKKDACVYDIVLDAAPASWEAAQAAFARVRDGFVVEPRRDRG